jgi:hypothetical protein
VDIPLLLGSCPHKLAAISHQPPTLLTAVSRLPRNGSWSSLYSLSMDGRENTASIIVCSLVAGGTSVSTGLFPSNSCCTVPCLHSCYLAIGLHVTIPRILMYHNLFSVDSCLNFKACTHELVTTIIQTKMSKSTQECYGFSPKAENLERCLVNIWLSPNAVSTWTVLSIINMRDPLNYETT